MEVKETKYEYVFATETVEIEITEEWMEILIELDRLEYNSNQTETRRHVRYDISNEGGWWLADEDLDPAVIMEKREEAAKRDKAFASLNEDQAELVKRAYEDGIGIVAYAEECGVTHQAISDRAEKIRRKMKKILD